MNEIHKMTTNDLSKKLSDLKAELFNLRFGHATGQLKNPMQINICKKEIARVLTVLKERELNIVRNIPNETKKNKTK